MNWVEKLQGFNEKAEIVIRIQQKWRKIGSHKKTKTKFTKFREAC